MNRREAIKTIGILSALAFVPYQLLGGNDLKAPNELAVWFNDNIGWLFKWLDNHKEVKSYEGMQIFKTDLLWFHKYAIAMTAVFGTYRVQNTPNPQRWMSGFFEQRGRLPTEKDKVYFESCMARWMERIEYPINALGYGLGHEPHFWHTECKLVIK